MPLRGRELAGIISSLLFIAAPAAAVDGVIEINQAAVAAGGVTPTDAPGFPATLSQPGSYRLTGNLDVTNEPTPQNVTAVVITADDVTLDLNGFSIIGPTKCSGLPVTSCTPTGTGDGVFANVTDQSRIAVVNGQIRGMGRDGLSIFGNTCRVERVTVSNVGRNGFNLIGCIVIAAVAEAVGEDGIKANVVRDSIATFCGEDGMSVTGTATNSLAERNGGNGFQAFRSTLIGNTSILNGGNGIDLNTGSVSNSTIESNDMAGVKILSGTVLGNNIRSNDKLGIEAGITPGEVGYGSNTLNNNNGGGANPQVTAGTNQLGANVCGGDLTCP